jgi:hypothetical protein
LWGARAWAEFHTRAHWKGGFVCVGRGIHLQVLIGMEIISSP